MFADTGDPATAVERREKTMLFLLEAAHRVALLAPAASRSMVSSLRSIAVASKTPTHHTLAQRLCGGCSQVYVPGVTCELRVRNPRRKAKKRRKKCQLQGLSKTSPGGNAPEPRASLGTSASSQALRKGRKKVWVRRAEPQVLEGAEPAPAPDSKGKGKGKGKSSGWKGKGGGQRADADYIQALSAVASGAQTRRARIRAIATRKSNCWCCNVCGQERRIPLPPRPTPARRKARSVAGQIAGTAEVTSNAEFGGGKKGKGKAKGVPGALDPRKQRVIDDARNAARAAKAAKAAKKAADTVMSVAAAKAAASQAASASAATAETTTDLASRPLTLLTTVSVSAGTSSTSGTSSTAASSSSTTPRAPKTSAAFSTAALLAAAASTQLDLDQVGDQTTVGTAAASASSTGEAGTAASPSTGDFSPPGLSSSAQSTGQPLSTGGGQGPNPVGKLPTLPTAASPSSSSSSSAAPATGPAEQTATAKPPAPTAPRADAQVGRPLGSAGSSGIPRNDLRAPQAPPLRQLHQQQQQQQSQQQLEQANAQGGGKRKRQKLSKLELALEAEKSKGSAPKSSRPGLNLDF